MSEPGRSVKMRGEGTDGAIATNEEKDDDGGLLFDSSRSRLHSLFQLGSPIKDSSPHVEVSRPVPFRVYSLFSITLFDGAVLGKISME
jgi:hypothetical protein